MNSADLKNETSVDNCELIKIKEDLMMKSNFNNVKEIEVNFKLFTYNYKLDLKFFKY